MKKCFVGFDVGIKGAMVVSEVENKEIKSFVVVKYNLDNYISTLKVYTKKYKNIFVYIEIVHSMPGQGVKSTFSFGERLGEINGMLKALDIITGSNIITNYITPVEWKKEFNLIKKDKKESCEIVSSLNPLVQFKGTRGGYNDGICDAYLIMLYGINKQFKGE